MIHTYIWHIVKDKELIDILIEHGAVIDTAVIDSCYHNKNELNEYILDLYYKYFL